LSVCRNEEMNKGGAYPRSCPTCGLWSEACPRGVKPDPTSGIDQKYYIGGSVDKFAVIIEKSYSQDYGSRGSPDYTNVNYETLQYFDTEAHLITWLKNQKELGYGKATIKKIIKYQELKAETEVVIKLK